MADLSRQLSFDLPGRTALGREDFFVSPANALAIDLIDRTDALPGRKLAICGPPGSGKTHLAHVWAVRYSARLISATDLPGLVLPDLAQTAVAVEDVPEIAGRDAAETALFHLHNLLAESGRPLLLTGGPAPHRWDIALPDLQSRVNGAAHAALDPPDDRLLAAVLAKLFADRQLTPRPDVIPYLLSVMDRSFAEASNMVDRIDRAALNQGRNVTRALAAELIRQAGTDETDTAATETRT
ncbi:MAG: chromosomal replication initiator DnaA [Marinibacterium sp.]